MRRKLWIHDIECEMLQTISGEDYNVHISSSGSWPSELSASSSDRSSPSSSTGNIYNICNIYTPLQYPPPPCRPEHETGHHELHLWWSIFHHLHQESNFKRNNKKYRKMKYVIDSSSHTHGKSIAV